MTGGSSHHGLARRQAGQDDQGGGWSGGARRDLSLPIADEMLDPANQLLSEALRMCFRLLKVLMAVLVVAYLCSGGGCVQPDVQVVVLRFGRIAGPPLEPGFHFTWPYPIDEKIPVPVKQKKSLLADLFWLRLKAEDRGKGLDELTSGGGSLDPVADGALITGDKNLIHILLRVTYTINDAVAYVSNIQDEEDLVKLSAESSLIAVVAGQDVDGILRGRTTNLISNQVRIRMQQALDRVESGIRVDIVSLEAKTPPLQVRQAFTDVQRAESEQLEKIEIAKAQRTETLNRAAGAGYELVLDKIREYEQARNGLDAERARSLRSELIGLLAYHASGEAARLINEARSYRENLVQEIEAEVQRFAQLLPEYRKNPKFLVEQLWLDTQREILGNKRLEKIRLPAGANEIRVRVNQNQEGKRAQEREDIKKQAEARR